LIVPRFLRPSRQTPSARHTAASRPPSNTVVPESGLRCGGRGSCARGWRHARQGKPRAHHARAGAPR
jgi:hypothetical protein